MSFEITHSYYNSIKIVPFPDMSKFRFKETKCLLINLDPITKRIQILEADF